MILHMNHNSRMYSADLMQPLDISMPLHGGENQMSAFHIPPAKFSPFTIGSFTGSVAAGAGCNVNDIFFNPHGNGTHTECVGHISSEFISLNKNLSNFFFTATLISVEPENYSGDFAIMPHQIEEAVGFGAEAIIIRTLPNDEGKKSKKYSGINPPYLHHSTAEFLCKKNVQHLLLDLPSVDKEEDGGELKAHHMFWNYPSAPRLSCTITELIYVDNKIIDGLYLLNLMIASFENDASPSKPVLYSLTERFS